MIDQLKTPALYCIGAMLAWALLKLAFYSFISYSYYFQYYSVEFSHVAYDKKGPSLVFVSDSEVYREMDFEWNDVLYCKDKDGEFAYFSVYPSNKDATPSKLRSKAKWHYRKAFPTNGVCYLEPGPSVVFPFGLKDTQTKFPNSDVRLRSKEFTLGTGLNE